MDYYERKALYLLEIAKGKKSRALKESIRTNIRIFLISVSVILVYIAILVLTLFGALALSPSVTSVKKFNLIPAILFSFLMVITIVMFVLLLLLIRIIIDLTQDIYMENKCYRYVLREQKNVQQTIGKSLSTNDIKVEEQKGT